MAFANAGGTGTLTKGQLDAQMSNIFNALDALFAQVQATQAFFVANVDANFTAGAGGPGPTGYASGDVTTMKSAMSDLDQLRQIYQGGSSQSTLRGNSNAYDYRTFTKLLWGTGAH